MKDAKQINSLDSNEKSAIFALKAKMFLEYSPKGYKLAIQSASVARNFHPTEYEWIAIWLKAKGQKRRYFNQFRMPEKDEIDAADILCTVKTNSSFLMQASLFYNEIAYFHKLINNGKESDQYYKLSSDLTL